MLKRSMFITKQSLLTSLMTASMLLSSALLSQSAMAENRVVSAGAGITELVLALDASDELVGVDSTSQIPEELNSVAKLGYHRMLSAEGILALSPTILLGSEAMGPQNTLEVLSNAKINVVVLPNSNTRVELISNIEQMGKLLNREHQANQLKQKIDLSFNQLDSKQQQLSELGDAPKVLFLLLQQDRPARVGGNNTAADIIINLAGGQNIAGFDGYKSVSQEGILALQPDVILISNRSDSESSDPVADLLKAMPLLAHTPAGEHQHIKTLSSHALIGNLGLSAITVANELASDFITIKKLQRHNHQ